MQLLAIWRIPLLAVVPFLSLVLRVGLMRRLPTSFCPFPFPKKPLTLFYIICTLPVVDLYMHESSFMCSGLTTYEMPAPPLSCFPENCLKRFLTQNSLRQSLDITNFLGEHASQTPLVAACFRTLSFRVRRYYHLNLAKILTALIKDAAIDRSAVTWITHTHTGQQVQLGHCIWPSVFMLLTVGWNQVVPHRDRLQ